MQSHFEVIVVGGSYSGLSAAMALGRLMRRVLVIDSGKPCNRFTPHSHNFITQDGEVPAVIASKARQQLQQYNTVKFFEGKAEAAVKKADGFEVVTNTGETFKTKKLIFATGVKDILPQLPGLAECWGVSVVHCPYCHGYEFRYKDTLILGNGEAAYHYAILVRQLADKLTILTNGKAEFTEIQREKLWDNNITVVEKGVAQIQHDNGSVTGVVFNDGGTIEASAIYTRPKNIQHCDIAEQLGCNLDDMGLLVTDMMQKTNVPGVFAAGDCASRMRSVSSAVASGTMAGAAVNMELSMDSFN